MREGCTLDARAHGNPKSSKHMLCFIGGQPADQCRDNTNALTGHIVSNDRQGPTMPQKRQECVSVDDFRFAHGVHAITQYPVR